jgi:hypothetical protein
MKEDLLAEIQNLLWEIRQLDEVIEQYPLSDNPVEKLMRFQFQHRQQIRIQRLVVALMQADLKFLEKGRFIRHLTTFLEKSEQDQTLTATHLEPQWRGIEKMLKARRPVAA